MSCETIFAKRQVDVSLVFPAATVTATARRQRPSDFKAVVVADPLVGADSHSGGQIDFDGDGGQGRPWEAVALRIRLSGPDRHLLKN
jgi:hypothetical protein